VLARDSTRLAPSADEPVALPTQFAPPGPRELRAQSFKRLQVGLFGLAAMLLLVALANIIMERARMADSSTGAESAALSAGPAGSTADPLADLGVIPAPDAAGTRARPPQHPAHP
jgi:hypothetical protein